MPSGPNERAFQIIQEATGQRPRLGWRPPEVDAEALKAERAEHAAKGGRGRARSLTASECSTIARRAAEVRWAKPRKTNPDGTLGDE